jgi:hypothetical protein
VGGGAGGVELALSMQARLKKLSNSAIEIHLFQRQTELMLNHNRSVRRLCKEILQKADIKLHLGEKVSNLFIENLFSSIPRGKPEFPNPYSEVLIQASLGSNFSPSNRRVR